MTQWVKALATKPDDLSLIHRTFMVEGERAYTNIHTYTHSDTHMYVLTLTCAQLHKLINFLKKNEIQFQVFSSNAGISSN